MDKETKTQLRHEAGLVFGGYDNEGNEQWIGTNKEWEKYEMLVDLKKQEINDPPEGSVYHPDYGKEVFDVKHIPF